MIKLLKRYKTPWIELGTFSVQSWASTRKLQPFLTVPFGQKIVVDTSDCASRPFKAL